MTLTMANVNGRIDDLAKLTDLDDQTIIQELKDRYERNIIYVSIKNNKLNIVTTTILSNEGLVVVLNRLKYFVKMPIDIVIL